MPRLLDQMEVTFELFKIALNGDPARRQRLLDIVDDIWRGDVPQHLKNAIMKAPHKKRIGQSTATTGVFRWWRTPARYC